MTPKQLLESCLRMKPDRILLAELRAEEAFDYLRNVNSGHPGSITSVHAASAELAFEQLVLLVKQSAGRPRARARATSRACCTCWSTWSSSSASSVTSASSSEIWFDPERKRRRRAAPKPAGTFSGARARMSAAARLAGAARRLRGRAGCRCLAALAACACAAAAMLVLSPLAGRSGDGTRRLSASRRRRRCCVASARGALQLEVSAAAAFSAALGYGVGRVLGAPRGTRAACTSAARWWLMSRSGAPAVPGHSRQGRAAAHERITRGRHRR